MRHRIHLVVPLLVLTLLALPAAAKDAPDDAPARMSDAESVVERGLRLTMQGQPTGGMLMKVGRLEGGALLLETDLLIRIRRANGGDGDVFETRTKSLDYYDAQGRLRWSHKRDEEAGVVSRTTVRYDDEQAHIRFSGPASQFEKSLKLPKSYDTELNVFRRLRRAFDAQEKASAEFSTLDAENQVFEPETMTVTGKATVEHGGKTHEGYAVTTLSNEGTATLVVDADFLPMRLSAMGIIEGTWVDGSPFDAGAVEISSYLPVEGVAPMDRFLESLELTIVATDPEEGTPSVRPLFEDTRYQKVQRVDGAWKLTLASTRLPYEVRPQKLPMTITDEAVKRYLAPTPQSQSDHPKIVAKAQEIVGKTKDSLEAANKIVRWVSRTLDKKSGVRGNATAVEVLESCEGDCSEHAALTVALCRAAGIPARNLSGIEYLVLEEGDPIAGFHAWAEVWVGRWVGVDATIPEVGTAARYILMGIDEPGETQNTESTIRAMFGKLKLRIDAWTPLDGERQVVKR